MSKKGGTATLARRISPCLKWHDLGGKFYLAQKIVALFPKHKHYVEPFAGGLSVLLTRDPEGVSEVVNDINQGLMNFWAVLADREQFARFMRFCEATPFCESTWESACIALSEHGSRMDPVSWAWSFFVVCRQSLAGRMDSFAPLSRTRTRSGMNEQASAWLNSIEGLPAVHARLKRVAILNRDALDVIRQQDGEHTLFYLDPPYWDDTRASPKVYEHEMTKEQHCDLLRELAKVKGNFILSGYRNAMYNGQAEACGWHRVDIDCPNNSAGGKEKRIMVESLWINFKPGE
jgi:DNA adenine methylase